MYHRALSVLGDHGLAEDAVHESFIRITKYLPRFNAMSEEERRYLCLTIAKNMALNILRKRGEILPLPENTPTVLCDISLGLDLTDAIESLNESLYQIVMLRLRYGFDTAETARLMGITPGAVRRRLNRARAILRKSLGGKEQKGVTNNEFIIRPGYN
jgi:RNA polymerase sigma-70 factor (ECF subfamily)